MAARPEFEELGEVEQDRFDAEHLEAIHRMAEEGQADLLTDEEERILQMHFQSGVDSTEHGANLAEHLDGPTLAMIAQDVCEWYEDDLSSLEDWRDREQRGIRALGVSPNVDGGASFEGASVVVHPLLAEAIIQFNARTMAEVWPASGPVKTRIVGDADRERREQSERVAEYLNYLYTDAMPDGYEQEDRLTFRLPLSGSMFKKLGWDPDYQAFRAWTLEPTHLVVPYSATSLETTPRYTEVIYQHRRDTLRRMRDGYYMNVPMSPGDEAFGRTDFDDELDAAEGRQQTSAANDDERDTILECNCYYDLPGFEDENPRTGELSGVGLPYLVTVDYVSQEVLAIRRNWREADRRKRRRVWHVHKRFWPGLGFYGYGFYHLAGGLTDAATGALRALLDSAQFANLQGGFRFRDARIAGNRDLAKEPLAPGEWAELEGATEDIRKAFLPHQYKEPSATLFSLLGYLDEKGQRLLSTTEAMVGEFKANMPVGTTLALIEQGSRVFSGIHRRLHESNAKEYQLAAELVGEYLPRDEYPYEIAGVERTVLREDFDRRVDIIPVSDPNTITGTHRIVLAQTMLDLHDRAPQLYEGVEVHRYMLEALRVTNPDRFLKDPKARRRQDPVSENMGLMMGQAAHAFPEQDHAAHVQVHEQWFGTLPQELQQQLLPAHQAHIAEHLAWAYRIKVQERMGVTLPIPYVPGMDEDESGSRELPPEIEAALSARIAQAVQTFEDEAQRFPPPDPPEVVEAKAKAEIAAEESQAEQARKQEAHDAEMDRRRDEAARKAAIEVEDRDRAAEFERGRTARELDAIDRRHAEELRFLRAQHDTRIDLMREQGIEQQRIEEERASLKQEIEARAADQKMERESEKAKADDAKRAQQESEAGAKRDAEFGKVTKLVERVEKVVADASKPDDRIERVLDVVDGVAKQTKDLANRIDRMEKDGTRRRKAVAAFAKKQDLKEVGEFIDDQESNDDG